MESKGHGLTDGEGNSSFYLGADRHVLPGSYIKLIATRMASKCNVTICFDCCSAGGMICGLPKQTTEYMSLLHPGCVKFPDFGGLKMIHIIRYSPTTCVKSLKTLNLSFQTVNFSAR